MIWKTNPGLPLVQARKSFQNAVVWTKMAESELELTYVEPGSCGQGLYEHLRSLDCTGGRVSTNKKW